MTPRSDAYRFKNRKIMLLLPPEIKRRRASKLDSPRRPQGSASAHHPQPRKSLGSPYLTRCGGGAPTARWSPPASRSRRPPARCSRGGGRASGGHRCYCSRRVEELVPISSLSHWPVPLPSPTLEAARTGVCDHGKAATRVGPERAGHGATRGGAHSHGAGQGGEEAWA